MVLHERLDNDFNQVATNLNIAPEGRDKKEKLINKEDLNNIYTQLGLLKPNAKSNFWLNEIWAIIAKNRDEGTLPEVPLSFAKNFARCILNFHH